MSGYTKHSKMYLEDGLTVKELINHLEQLDGDMEIRILDMLNGQCVVNHIEIVSEGSHKWDKQNPKFVSIW